MYDVIVIGGGQAGLACAYYLRRAGLRYVILDDQPHAGGAWQHAWPSLTLFSPVEFSSLPGWLMPRSEHYFPPRDEVIEYLTRFEERYDIPVIRPARVEEVTRIDSVYHIRTQSFQYTTPCVISATGTWSAPFIPEYPGRELFQGHHLHSGLYDGPEPLTGQHVIVVGGGNSGAQILAEVSRVATTTWVTLKPPVLLPDDVDGRVLFYESSRRYKAVQDGEVAPPRYDLGSIVMVPSVKEARERGVLVSEPSFTRIGEHEVIWEGETARAVHADAIIWCTGFGFALQHLKSLGVIHANGRIPTEGTRATEIDGLWLVGYGGWTGFASSTLIGVGRTARSTVEEILAYRAATSE